ncbi:hypothetical protein [Microbacterium sp. bgisy203]|uniref:hypothetical protein n=1 Tax=Microbacterium sp. bgisy203 TaxID=3413799 RepID=UPI003D75FCC0
MMRLHADADPALWVPVTGSLGLRGRRRRKRAIGMLFAQANAAMGAAPRAGTGFAAWAASQAAPLLLRQADGRVLVWTWKDDPELVVALAQIQQATSQLRTARAMMPIEYDDTEDFRSPYLGVGEKLAVPVPRASGGGTAAGTGPGAAASVPPYVTYTWDAGSAFVTLTAIGGDRERFGTVERALDDLARTLRIVDDVAVGESPTVLRLDPS